MFARRDDDEARKSERDAGRAAAETDRQDS